MLLEAVATRLRGAARDADVITRFGGDEFVILQASIRSLDQAEKLSPRAYSTHSQVPTIWTDTKLFLSPHWGRAAKSRIEQDQFLRDADMALYQAKSEGRGTGAGLKQNWPPAPERAEISKSICAVR